MTVVILRLSGLDAAEAMEAANELLSARDKHPVLRRTLVIDDTVALIDHTRVYQRLLTARRLERLLCVALGPLGPEGPGGQSPQLRVPPNISSRQGSAVLWVSDAQGIDWRLSAMAIADGHRGSSVNGLDYLLEVLSVDDVYDTVLRTMVEQVPDGVASPGLKLAGADDAAASFAAALVLAIRRLTGSGLGLAAGTEVPFASLQPTASWTVDLAEDGQLAAYRDRVIDSAGAITEALAKPRGGLLRKGGPDVRDDVIATGKDLHAFRDRVVGLFTEAQSAGELTETQRSRVTAAGVLLPTPPPVTARNADNQTAGADGGRSIVSRTVDQALRSGDTLPRVIRRLTLTGQQLKHKGSASYLPDVENACPSSLLGRFASPAPRPPGKAGAEAWQRGLGLEEAARAAASLADLVIAVARKEWSGGATVADEVSRTRIALDGISKRLADHADAAGTPAVSSARASRLARLSESLTPFLYDLVDKVLAAESATPSSGGQEAYERAQDKTGGLLAEWREEATKNGPLSPPPFATSVVHDHTYADDDIAAIREALLHDPRQEMWQLCGPDDIGALNAAESPQVVAFAPLPTKNVLGRVLPPDMKDMKWTTSGSHAGLIRLVPLRPSATWLEWADGQAPADE
jgi:hypothetical protein